MTSRPPDTHHPRSIDHLPLFVAAKLSVLACCVALLSRQKYFVRDYNRGTCTVAKGFDSCLSLQRPRCVHKNQLKMIRQLSFFANATSPFFPFRMTFVSCSVAHRAKSCCNVMTSKIKLPVLQKWCKLLSTTYDYIILPKFYSFSFK